MTKEEQEQIDDLLDELELLDEIEEMYDESIKDFIKLIDDIIIKSLEYDKEEKEPHKCVCALKVLMKKGCQCGGK